MDLYLSNISEKIKIGENILEELVDFISNRDAIDYYCTKCNKIKTFIQKNSENVVVVEPIKDGSYKALNMYHLKMKDDKMIYNDSDWLGHEISYTFYKSLENFYIFKTFKCPTCNNSIVMIFYYDNGYISKIYQSYISNIMSDEDIIKYQQLKLLSENDITELNKANECKKIGYNIASFVYIRRIFETLLKRIYIEYKDNVKISEKRNNFEECTTKEKVNCLKNYLPQILNNSNDTDYYNKMYKLLSEGIHKLDEAICEKLFNVLYDSVVMILEKESERKKGEKRIKDVNQNFNEIFSKK